MRPSVSIAPVPHQPELDITKGGAEVEVFFQVVARKFLGVASVCKLDVFDETGKVWFFFECSEKRGVQWSCNADDDMRIQLFAC